MVGARYCKLYRHPPVAHVLADIVISYKQKKHLIGQDENKQNRGYHMQVSFKITYSKRVPVVLYRNRTTMTTHLLLHVFQRIEICNDNIWRRKQLKQS